MIQATLRAEQAIATIGSWMSSVKLELAHNKTELMVVSSHRSAQHGTIQVGGFRIVSRRQLTYLGVVFDDRLNFYHHLDYIVDKATRTMDCLERLMLNRAGPRSSRRRVIATVISAIMRYGGPVWASCLKYKTHVRKIMRVHRRCAIKVASALCTCSHDAASVITGMIPLHLLLQEDQRIYVRRASGEDVSAVKAAEHTYATYIRNIRKVATRMKFIRTRKMDTRAHQGGQTMDNEEAWRN